MPVYAKRRRAAEAVRRVYGFAQVDTTVDSCCSLHIKPLFLPNEIISTLSVRPDSSCTVEIPCMIQIMWSQEVRREIHTINLD